ncbi:MAG: hypothetical protein ACM3ZF_03930 [Mycobacterium leprae]
MLDAFFEGLGSNATEVLSANLDRASARLVQLVEAEQRRFMAKPRYDEVVELKTFSPARATDREVSADRHSAFSKSLAYEGWERSLFPLAWFDSRTERTVANMVDSDRDVECWVRLHIGELPILWSSGGRKVVIENDGTHYVVEVKMNKEMSSADMLGKREAARRWANHVTADSRTRQGVLTGVRVRRGHGEGFLGRPEESGSVTRSSPRGPDGLAMRRDDPPGAEELWPVAVQDVEDHLLGLIFDRRLKILAGVVAEPPDEVGAGIGHHVSVDLEFESEPYSCRAHLSSPRGEGWLWRCGRPQ